MVSSSLPSLTVPLLRYARESPAYQNEPLLSLSNCLISQRSHKEKKQRQTTNNNSNKSSSSSNSAYALSLQISLLDITWFSYPVASQCIGYWIRGHRGRPYKKKKNKKKNLELSHEDRQGQGYDRERRRNENWPNGDPSIQIVIILMLAWGVNLCGIGPLFCTVDEKSAKIPFPRYERAVSMYSVHLASPLQTGNEQTHVREARSRRTPSLSTPGRALKIKCARDYREIVESSKRTKLSKHNPGY